MPRIPKNTSRLPRERTIVVDFPPESDLIVGATVTESFPAPSGAKEGDSITVTPLANAGGAPFMGYAPPGLIFYAAMLSPGVVGVRGTNASNGEIDLPATRLRLTFRRP